MKIDKITFKGEQAWLVIRSEQGDYLGTWHTSHPAFVKAIRVDMPKRLEFKDEK